MDSTEVKPSPVSAPAAAVKAPTPQVAEKKAEPKSAPKQAVKAAPASVKPAPKAPSKTAPKAPAKTAASAKVASKVKAEPKPKAEKPLKEKKPKLVRDSFTIPKAEFVVLADMKLRAGKLSRQIKKSELIRAGIKALAAMSDSAFLAALKAVPAIKTGRPSKD